MQEITDLEAIQLADTIDKLETEKLLVEKKFEVGSLVEKCVLSNKKATELADEYYKFCVEEITSAAKCAVLQIMPSIIKYADKQMSLLGLTLTPEERLSCNERCYEKLITEFEEHLKERKDQSGSLINYARALGMYLNSKSFSYMLRILNSNYTDIAVENKWAALRSKLTSIITETVGETYGVAQRLEAIKVKNYMAPMVDLLGTNILQRLEQGEADQIPLDRAIKTFGEVAAALAKMTGESVDRQEVTVGFSQIHQRLQELKQAGVKPMIPTERKFIE